MLERQYHPNILAIPNSLECRIIQRLNRFVVEVSAEGRQSRAYINNTGRLQEFLVAGEGGFCLKNERPGRTDYRLFAIREGKLGALIDTQLQMRAFERALEMNLIPWLAGYRVLKRNALLGDSLIDYLIGDERRDMFLEVKSAVLREGQFAMYPDCPSARGRRHVRELIAHVKAGGKATILFIAALPGVAVFKPNRLADPKLAQLIVEAHHAGVEVKSVGLYYQPRDSSVRLSSADLAINLEVL